MSGMGRQKTTAPVLLFEFKHTVLALRVVYSSARAIPFNTVRQHAILVPELVIWSA